MLEIINLSEGKLDLLEIANKKNFLLIEMKEIIQTMIKEKIFFKKNEREVLFFKKNCIIKQNLYFFKKKFKKIIFLKI